jgi:hypothetical protein
MNSSGLTNGSSAQTRFAGLALNLMLGTVETDLSVPPDPRPIAGFWGARASFCPKPIQDPLLYNGSDLINVWAAPYRAQPREAKEAHAKWCSALPSMPNLRYVWFHDTVTQSLFEAACSLPKLEGLCIDWNRINDLEPLLAPSTLRYLQLGASGYVKTLEPLARLSNLKWLQVSNVSKSIGLEDLAPLTSLEGLGYCGVEGARKTIESFSPLGNHTSLEWLHLGAVHTRDKSLRPLGTLTNLRWLGLGKFFSDSEFRWLSEQLPRTHCNWFPPSSVWRGA